MADGSIDAAFDALEAECADIIRGMTVEIFLHTLQMSPQYFGRYASSWTYQVGKPELGWTNPEFVYEGEDQGYAMLHRKGDYPALASAIQHNTGRDNAFRLGETVYISNSADHGEGPYAQGIENGTVKLRSVNQPGRPLGRAIDRAATWFATSVNPKHAAELKALRLY